MTLTLSELASDATKEIHSALLEGGAKAMRNTIYLQMERAISWARDLQHAIENGETQPETTSNTPQRCRVGARVFEARDTTPDESGDYPCDGCAGYGKNDGGELCALLGICHALPNHHVTWHEIGCVIDGKVYLRKPKVEPGSCQGCSLCQKDEACANLPQGVNRCNAIWVEETS